MLKLATSTEFVQVPLAGPYDNLTVYTVYMAIIPEGTGEPLDTDYQAASWLDGEVSYKPGTGVLVQGMYAVYVRIVTADEDVRLLAGRLRVGDPRT